MMLSIISSVYQPSVCNLDGQKCRASSRSVDTTLLGLAQNRADTCVGVLNEGTCISVEIDRLARVEEHSLLGIDLQDKVFERTQTNHSRYSISLLLGATVEFTELVRHLASGRNHISNEVIGINDRTLTRLHLTLRQLNHTVREVENLVAPIVAQLFEVQIRKQLQRARRTSTIS